MTVPAPEKRIDDLRAEMHRGFDQVGHRFDRVEGEIGQLRSEMKGGFETLHRTLIWFFGSILVSVIAGAVVLVLTHS